jgi:hypothetical protein
MIFLEQLVVINLYKINYNTFLPSMSRCSEYLLICDITTKVKCISYFLDS